MCVRDVDASKESLGAKRCSGRRAGFCFDGCLVDNSRNGTVEAVNSVERQVRSCDEQAGQSPKLARFKDWGIRDEG